MLISAWSRSFHAKAQRIAKSAKEIKKPRAWGVFLGVLCDSLRLCVKCLASASLEPLTAKPRQIVDHNRSVRIDSLGNSPHAAFDNLFVVENDG